MKNTRNVSWIVIMFFALYCILPDYLALELSPALPLLTASRIALLCLVLWALTRRGPSGLALTGDKPLRFGLLGFFALMTAANIPHFGASLGDTLKGIGVALEGYLVVWGITRMLDSRRAVLSALWTLVLASGAVGVIAAVGCAVGENPFHVLRTVERNALMSEYIRLGLLRAAAGFGHPVYYGAFCAVMLPLCMYFVYTKTGHCRILAMGCAAMNVTGLVLSNSRGSILAAICVGVVILVLSFRQPKLLLTRWLPVLAMALVVLILVVTVAGAGITFLSDVTVSVAQSVIEPELAPGTSEPEQLSGEYGENINGVSSRMAQLTGILWTLERGPVFGLGYNAHMRGLVSYQWEPGRWQATPTFDMAPVAIICQYGFVGLAGYCLLYGTALWCMFRSRRDPLMRCLLTMALTFGLCMLSVSGMDALQWVLLGVLTSLVNVTREQKVEAYGV